MEEGIGSGWDRTEVVGLAEEHFVSCGGHCPFVQLYVPCESSEPDFGRTDLDELVLAHELVVHQSQPSRKMNQNRNFLLKKCNGAI